MIKMMEGAVLVQSPSSSRRDGGMLSRDKSSGLHNGPPQVQQLNVRNHHNHHHHHHHSLQSSSSEKRISSSKIQPSSASSLELLTKMALQYSLYCQTDLSAQISRLEEYLQESIAKLEEQQSLFEIKEIESREWTQVILPQLVKQAQLMSANLNKRLDSLNELIVNIKMVLDQLEKQITLAEQKMGLNPSSSSFRSVFKYFMKSDSSSAQSSDQADGIGWEGVKGQFLCEDPLNLDTYFKSS